MRRKFRTASTMKTITYGLFIYVSLTTFNGISASPLEPRHELSKAIPTLSKCDLPSIIKKSKYVADCVNTTTNAPLPELSYGTRAQYLCTGIFETVNKICESNPTSINETSFDIEIEESRSRAGNNRTKFCFLIKDSFSKLSKNSTTISTAYPNIIKLNQNLIPECHAYCSCNLTIPVHPLCVVLYWANEILVSPKTPGKHDPILSQQKKTTKEDIIHSSSSQAAQSNAETVDTLITRTETPMSQENLEGSHKEKDIKPKAPVSNSIVKNSASTTNILSSEQNGRVGPSETPQKKDAARKEEIEKNKNKTGDDAAAKMKPADETKDKIKDKSQVSGAAEPEDIKPVRPDINDNGDEEQHPENLPGDDSVNFNGDDEDTGSKVSENLDAPPTQGKNVASSSLNPTAANSNHGKEDESGGKETAETDQESVAPQDHTLVHSGGPPDPPQHFFAYFMAVSFICIVCYIGYHKKHKIMGIIFEGRKSRGGRGRRRPNTAGYRKLDCNLEEAVTSQCNSNVTHVIY